MFFKAGSRASLIIIEKQNEILHKYKPIGLNFSRCSFFSTTIHAPIVISVPNLITM